MKHFILAICLLTVAACGPDEPPEPTFGAEFSTPDLDTYIPWALEIDDLNGSGDANLFVGDDPADGSASAQLPASDKTFVDWTDLDLAKHVLYDNVYDSGKDPTSFPQANECLNSSKVLSKMDLTYVAAASNSEYVYFLVQRASNNGDAGYYWLFTKKEPRIIPGGGPCKAEQGQLLYDISGPEEGGSGDILFAGHFSPSGGPLLTAYRASSTRDGVPATEAIDFESGFWVEDPNGVENAVVNTTPTSAGAFGDIGVKSFDGGDLGAELVAEAAVPLSVFNSGSSCGAFYYGSVITRPSGSGGTSPDLKDLAGPARFNFGSVTATATLVGSCDSQLSYSAGSQGPDGEPVPGVVCEWEFSDGSQATGCEGVKPATPGSYSATVHVSDPNSSCDDDAESNTVQVYDPLGIELTTEAGALMCPMDSDAVTYTAVITGGTGDNTVSWDGASCAGTSCTINPSDSAFCASVDISAMVSDDRGLCDSATSETETYTKTTTVTATDN